MIKRASIFFVLYLSFFTNAHAGNINFGKVLACGTDDAKAECIKPNKKPQYYVEQSIKYFRTMETSVSVMVQPNYSKKVVRWEWEPWLLLTGYGKVNLIWTDTLLKLFKTAYDKLDCRFFKKNPFGRCHVIFDYGGLKCPIYEEFTFNSQGEMTFIEAWTDKPGYLPYKDPKDHWAEGKDVYRLSTKIPGLGNKKGKIKIDSRGMKQMAKYDEDVKDFVKRAKAPYKEYFKELRHHSSDVLAGCDPPNLIKHQFNRLDIKQAFKKFHAEIEKKKKEIKKKSENWKKRK